MPCVVRDETETAAGGSCLAFAAVQIVVHMIYFLHMDAKSEGGWNLMALIFTIVLVVITLTVRASMQAAAVSKAWPTAR